MKKTKKVTFIIGSGASYGHLPRGILKTPPSMKDFLSRSVSEGVLNEINFPDLISEALSRTNLFTPLAAFKKIEETENLEKFLCGISDSWLLHLAMFYIVKYLGTYCKSNVTNDSAYVKLAKFIKENSNDIAGIINLNYDTLLDQALKNENISISYGLESNQSNMIKYIKPHGSLNFRFKSPIIIDCKDWQEYLNKRNCFIHSNIFYGKIENYTPNFNFEDDFLQEGKLQYLPVIIMPFGKNKEYEQFNEYKKMWEQISIIISETTELIVIGCNLNNEDKILWKHICNLKKRSTEIRIISSNLENAKKVFFKFRQKNFKKIYPVNAKGFYEYANYYLSKGNI